MLCLMLQYIHHTNEESEEHIRCVEAGAGKYDYF